MTSRRKVKIWDHPFYYFLFLIACILSITSPSSCDTTATTEVDSDRGVDERTITEPNLYVTADGGTDTNTLFPDRGNNTSNCTCDTNAHRGETCECPSGNTIKEKMKEVSGLLEEMLDKYDKRLRPGYEAEEPVEVMLNLNIRSLGPISEMDMIFTMDCYFRQVWTDKRLALNFSSFDHIQLSIKILDRIWFPDTVFYNGMKSYLHTITTPNRFIRISRDGTVLFSQRLTVRALCKMKLQKYPLDTQECPLHIGSFAYSSSDVTYVWRHENPVEMSKDMRLSQFDLMELPINFTSLSFFKGAWHTVLSVNFKLSRHMGYFLINVYVPCCLLVILSWVAFWINREATADRIALGTTTVLTMTFLGLESRSDLPRVSYTTALDIYIAMAFTFVLATMVQFAAVHNYTKHGYGEPLPPPPPHHEEEEEEEEKVNLLPRGTRTAQLKRAHNSHNGGAQPHLTKATVKRAASNVWRRLTQKRKPKRKTPEEQRNSVSKIDRASRILFPLTFLLFNVGYMTVYYSI